MAVTRSRDVAELRANLTFEPAKINLQQAQYQCEHGGRRSACVKAEVCFAYRVKSEQQDLNSATGEPLRTAWPSLRASVAHLLVRPAEIRYDLTLDALRAKARASFIEGDRRISKTLPIRGRESRCVQETFMMEVSRAGTRR